jgi:hypothetical protein
MVIRRCLGMVILSSIGCRAPHTSYRSDNNKASVAQEEHATRHTRKVAWRELRWNDGSFASLRDGSRVRAILKDSAAYARTWREVTGDTAQPPRVDFRGDLVLLLAAPSQTRGGYAITVDSVFVSPGSDTVNVSVREISPGPRCSEPDDGSRPIVAGTIPNTSGAIRFLESESVKDCTS